MPGAGLCAPGRSSERPRAVIELRVREGMQYEAIKAHCRLGAETLNPRLHRVFKRARISVVLSVNTGYE